MRMPSASPASAAKACRESGQGRMVKSAAGESTMPSIVPSRGEALVYVGG
jgi:hypothetical protein